MDRLKPRLVFLFLLLFGVFAAHSATTNSFKNFETAPVHPVALSPDGLSLAVCNLPDGRVELFGLESGFPQFRVSISVGIDPVTVRFRNDTELWVVNHISDSITIIDLPKLAVRGLIGTRDGPADVVFAGSPLRAFVSCPPENVVQVIDPDSLAVLRSIPIKAERPKALAVSRDGSKVYAAIFESGNGSTILAPAFTALGHVPAAGPADVDFGPHGGQNPPPNLGAQFFPAFGTNFSATNLPPRVTMIVKKQADGRWMDDNKGDWSSFISGTNAPFSGRAFGWDLLDRDIAVIDAASFEVSFIERLMNICLDLAVNPVSGEIAMIGSDAENHLRFEPVLQSIFTRVSLALVQPTNASRRIFDLNPHLDYTRRTIPMAERKKSLGDPRAALWNSDGTRLYVTGMGSDNLAVFDAAGKRLATVPMPSGPSGMALGRERLYVFNRFASSLSVLHSETLAIIGSIPIYDPTPAPIKEGRPHFYNTHKTSGLGQAACASCHLDARADRLAWDLGSQLGSMKNIAITNRNFGAEIPAVTNHFHPMKGPMVTQTLQDIIGHEPFHWRGDRDGIEEFNPTFKELQGADEELTDDEMQQFENFLASIHFPPNPRRQFDNSLSRNVRLEGHVALGRGTLAKDAPLPAGDAVAGLNLFRSLNQTCSQCHTLPSGMGADLFFRNNRWNTIPAGPHGERHLALSATERSHALPFKIPQLRNLGEKTGLDYRGASVSGFGFFHDGRVDTLTRLLQEGFGLQNDKQTADIIAFLISFSGSDLPAAPVQNGNFPPGDFSRDVAASVGRQLLLPGDSAALDAFIARANSSTGRVQLIVKGNHEGVLRGWLFQTNRFRPDGPGPALARSNLLALASAENKFLFTLVPAGTGHRLGIDRDEDGQLDFEESGLQSQDSRTVRLSIGPVERGLIPLIIHARSGQRFRIFSKNTLRESSWTLVGEPERVASGGPATNRVPIVPGNGERYYRVEMIP